MYNSLVKSERLNIRITPEQHEILRRAAEVGGQTISEYVLDRVLADAQDDLTDRRVFTVGAAAWNELQNRLVRPPQRNPALARLLATPAPWDESATSDDAELSADDVRKVLAEARRNFRVAYMSFVELAAVLEPEAVQERAG